MSDKDVVLNDECTDSEGDLGEVIELSDSFVDSHFENLLHFDKLLEDMGAGISMRGDSWIKFSLEVLEHIETYTIPQYGDAGADRVTKWSVDDCLQAVSKRISRYGRNSRNNQQELDFLKMAHEIQLAAEKYDQFAKDELTENEAEKINVDDLGYASCSKCGTVLHPDWVNNYCYNCGCRIIKKETLEGVKNV